MVSEKALIKSRAQKYLSRGNYKKALGEFQKNVQLDSTNLRARLKVGDLLHKLKRAEPRVILGYLRGGDFFEEISLIFNRPRMASVRTTKTTELLELEKQDFDDVVGAYPSIKGTLDAFSRKRMEVTSQMISSFSSSSWAKKATAAMV